MVSFVNWLWSQSQLHGQTSVHVFVICFFLILFTSERFILYHHMMINPGNWSAIFLFISVFECWRLLVFPVKSWALRTATDLSACCYSKTRIFLIATICRLHIYKSHTQMTIIRPKPWFCGKQPLLLCRECHIYIPHFYCFLCCLLSVFIAAKGKVFSLLWSFSVTRFHKCVHFG